MSLKQTRDTHSVQISVLQHRLEDQTNRTSRNTLIIRGIKDGEDVNDWEETRDILCKTLAPIVQLTAVQISQMIERVHRDPGNPERQQEGPGVIHAKFFNWNHCQQLMKLMRKHGKGSNI